MNERSLLPLTLLSLMVAGAAARPEAQAPAGAHTYETWIERRAAAAFNPSAATQSTREGHYRIDAHVLLPLGLISPQIWSLSDVGTAICAHREIALDATNSLETWELQAISKPERAHGFNRQGLFREAILRTPEGRAWTAYFGAMTTWSEQSLSEARQVANGPQPDTFEAIDGLTSPLEAQASIFKVAPGRKVTNPTELWPTLRPLLATRPPRTQKSLTGTEATRLPTLAFLGALTTSLASAADHRDRPLPPLSTRVLFMHNAKVRVLELQSIKRAASRGRSFAGTLVRVPDDVFELGYRILTPGGGDASFKIWAELPSVAPGTTRAAIIPLMADVRIKAYLELEFRRTE